MRYIIFAVTLLLAAVALGGEIASLHQKFAKATPDLAKSRTHEQVDSEDHGITEIGLERTACFGKCPIYSVVIKSDGSVQYTGEKFVERLGKHRGKTRGSFNALAQF